MPTVSVVRSVLFERLGRSYTEEELTPSPDAPVLGDYRMAPADKDFFDLCFDFGIELDEITSEQAQLEKMMGDSEKEEGRSDKKKSKKKKQVLKKKVSEASTEIIYKIDMPANRYDLLCLEGIVRALQVFEEKASPCEYTSIRTTTPEVMTITSEVKEIRPYVACAILRDISFDDISYQSFIELQEKLHFNICRRRTLVSVGTHDLDSIKGPFIYTAKPPAKIKFVPLQQTGVPNKQFTADELFEFYKTNDAGKHLRPYLDILNGFTKYPVIYDSDGVLLSLPPIINGEHSRISKDTKNVFIEVTGVDKTKTHIVLNTIVAMFSEYCSNPFEIEVVDIVEPDGSSAGTPNLTPTVVNAEVAYINSAIGVKLTQNEMINLLKMMGLPSKADDGMLSAFVPITRSDVLHACDIMEDVAIAYGFNNLTITIPSTATVGKQFPLNKFTDLIRPEIAMAGFTEVLTLSLCSREEIFSFLKREQDEERAVQISNPKTLEYQVGRTTLLVGLLKSVYANKHLPMPLNIFEISDIMLLDSESDVGAKNERYLAAVHCDKRGSGFEIVQGLLDRVMQLLGIPFQKPLTEGGNFYTIKPSSDKTFFEGRRADVLLKGKKIGVFGMLHPEVVGNFKLYMPCSALEISIEALLSTRKGL